VIVVIVAFTLALGCAIAGMIVDPVEEGRLRVALALATAVLMIIGAMLAPEV
jgi:hypothetical protein